MTTTVRVRTLLFDLDGTLVDSTPAVNRCWVKIADGLGIDPERILGRFHGMPAWMALQQVDPTLDEATLRRADAEILELQEHDVDGIAAIPGAADLLAGLPDHAWAIVTSCSTTLARLRLGVAGLPTPPVMVCAEHVRRGKPDPEPYVLGATRMGVPTEDCLVIEDAPAGVTSAREAGCSVLGLTTSHPSLDAPTVPDLTAVTAQRDEAGWWNISW